MKGMELRPIAINIRDSMELIAELLVNHEIIFKFGLLCSSIIVLMITIGMTI